MRWVAVLACLPLIAAANGVELANVKQKNLLLGTEADTCVIIARIAYVKLRTKSDNADELRELDKCIANGKDLAKSAHGEVKAAMKKKPAQAELTEWRLEWMAAFDATALKDGETEGQYLRRAQEARAKVDRATNKIEIALEQ